MKNEQKFPFLPLSSKELHFLETLKAALMTPVVVPLPYSVEDLALDTDARSDQAVCNLLQKELDKWKKLVGFGYKSLKNTEQRYDTPQREFLATVW